jgi:hypothetical protein
MNEPILTSSRDVFFYAVPMLVGLFLGMLRLDQFMSTPRGRTPVRRALTGCDANGEPLLSDPDGRPSE